MRLFEIRFPHLYNNVFGFGIWAWNINTKIGHPVFEISVPYSNCAYCKFVKKEEHDGCLNKWSVFFNNLKQFKIKYYNWQYIYK